MEFAIALFNSLVALFVSLLVIKKFINKSNIVNKVLKVFTATMVGAVVFEVILYLLTTIIVIQCGGIGTMCDIAYIALLFWFPFYLVISLIVTTILIRKKF